VYRMARKANAWCSGVTQVAIRVGFFSIVASRKSLNHSLIQHPQAAVSATHYFEGDLNSTHNPVPFDML
jgi:hypothetical protein